MVLIFTKYHGTGNDFIIVDNRNHLYNLSPFQINKICNRHTGIGADGLISLEDSVDYDFKMRYFNADGNEGTMCGNGGRCIAAFAREHNMIDHSASFETIDGVHRAQILNSDKSISLVKLSLNTVDHVSRMGEAYVLNTGSPHYVQFIEPSLKIDIESEGRKIRYSKAFKSGGINVNFVTLLKDTIYVNTYERGVEAETLSCGTGVTASAIAASLKQNFENGLHKVKVETKGGSLEVAFSKKGEKNFNDIYITGPATRVFNGDITL